ncbi:hypothetical protein [Archangium lipolyticum]|nr:hypothetical protein [Archangium lipolyticum]
MMFMGAPVVVALLFDAGRGLKHLRVRQGEKLAESPCSSARGVG